MKIKYDGNLITTTLVLTFRGVSLQLNDVVIDTGASHTVISPDAVEEIGICYETGDIVYEAYGIGGSVPFYTKMMDEIRIGEMSVRDMEIDIGVLPKEHKGLLGLDILKESGFIIDLSRLELRLP